MHNKETMVRIIEQFQKELNLPCLRGKSAGRVTVIVSTQMSVIISDATKE